MIARGTAKRPRKGDGHEERAFSRPYLFLGAAHPVPDGGADDVARRPLFSARRGPQAAAGLQAPSVFHGLSRPRPCVALRGVEDGPCRLPTIELWGARITMAVLAKHLGPYIHSRGVEDGPPLADDRGVGPVMAVVAAIKAGYCSSRNGWHCCFERVARTQSIRCGAYKLPAGRDLYSACKLCLCACLCVCVCVCLCVCERVRVY